MINLVKNPIPTVLATNAMTWTAEYLTALAAGLVPDTIQRRYRHPDIKAAIKEETHEKCAYCESRVAHVYPGDVEHIAPKAIVPNRVFDWSNLTYACSICNNKKGDYYNIANQLLNPYEDEPADHLVAFGPSIFHHPGDPRGEITQKRLALNRTELIEKRQEKLEALNELIERWSAQLPGGLRDTLRDQILAEADRDKEFSFVLRSYIHSRCGF